jgi:siroheme synthase-like protein
VSAFGYPVFLELAGRRCVVVGEGAVREGKVEGLLAAGADDVLVLAERPDARLTAMAEVEGVRVERRAWRPGDLEGAFLVVAASPDPQERAAIAREARERRAWVNVIDDVPNCDWAAPAVVRRGELVVAVGTGGASPALARKIREELGSRYGPEWAEVAAVLRRVREETLPLLPSFAERAQRWREALDLEEAAALVREDRADELEERLRSRLLGAPV